MADPHWAETTLLLHLDGADPLWKNDASDFNLDVGSVFGTYAGNLASGEYSQCAGRTGISAFSRAEIAHDLNHCAFSGPFTIEVSAFVAATAGVRGLLAKWLTTGNQRSWAIYYSGGWGAALSTDGTAATETDLVGPAATINTWTKLCVERNAANKVRFYVNGAMVASATVTGTIFANTGAPVSLGALNLVNCQTGDRIDEVRITKGVARYDSDAGYTVASAPFPEGAVLTSPERVSQHGMLVLAYMGADERVSQHGMLVLAEMEAHDQISQHGMLVLAEYQPCHTRRAQLWRIKRKDGVALCFTSHDRPITLGAYTYTPCDSLMASASEQSADMEGASNIELSGIISDDAISEEDIEAGLYDDAYVEVFLVTWSMPDDAYISADTMRRLNAGWIGDISAGENGVTMEVLGPGQRLAQKSMVEVFATGCRFTFGDPLTCGIDRESMALPGAVTQVTDNGAFIGGLSLTTGGAQYNQGAVRWITGPNAGVECEVKDAVFSTGDVVALVLWSPAPFLPQVGDTFELLPGCDRLGTTCKDVYSNKPNFGGFDKIPGNDAISKTPDAKN